jgi:hypothetical protein
LEDTPTNPRGALVGAEDYGTASRSSFHLASSGNSKNIATSGEKEQNVPIMFLERGWRQYACSGGSGCPAGFILITGIDGTRWAVRQQSVTIIHDADECRDETNLFLHGGHVVRVPCPLDEVLA